MSHSIFLFQRSRGRELAHSCDKDQSEHLASCHPERIVFVKSSVSQAVRYESTFGLEESHHRHPKWKSIVEHFYKVTKCTLTLTYDGTWIAHTYIVITANLMRLITTFSSWTSYYRSDQPDYQHPLHHPHHHHHPHHQSCPHVEGGRGGYRLDTSLDIPETGLDISVETHSEHSSTEHSRNISAGASVSRWGLLWSIYCSF